MKRTLQLLAALVLVAGLGLWAEHRPRNRHLRRQFVPGVNFLGATLLGAGAPAGTPILFQKPTV